MAFDLETTLAALGSSERIRSRERAAFTAIAGDTRRVVIAGCGALGKRALAAARDAGLDVVASADNDRTLWGQSVAGVPILSPADALAEHAQAFFLVAIFNSRAVREQLRALGCAKVVPFPMFYWQFSKYMETDTLLQLPHRIVERADLLRDAYRRLSDEPSRIEFAAQVHWRCTLDYERLPPADGPDRMYFATGLATLSREEVLVDCGAFDGDSIRLFLNNTSNAFQQVLAFEPDPANRAKLTSFVEMLPRSCQQRVTVFPYCVGDINGPVSFDATGTMGSHIVGERGTGSECRRLDDMLEGVSATFIKMDVEGAEPATLRGALQTIRRSRPVLAVCAYHECEHLWTLPALLHEALPDYRIFLRRYAEECWELVYYAVPPERVAGGIVSA